MRGHPANGVLAVRTTCTKLSVEVVEAYLDWSSSDPVSTFTVSRVREWLTLSMSNSEQPTSHLREWLGDVGGVTSWKSLDAASQKRCAELFLLEVPGPHSWWGPATTIQLAARHLAAAARKESEPKLWVGTDFEAHADRIPGLGDLISQQGFRTEAAKCVAEELGIADDDPLINELFGHPELRSLITAHTDVGLAQLANTILCGLTFARTHVPAWMLERLRYTDRERAADTEALFAKFSTGAAHALWADWDAVVDTAETRYFHGEVAQQSLDGIAAEPSPLERWLAALLELVESSQRTWLQRNYDGRPGRSDKVHNHQDIVQLVKTSVLDGTGLPHRKRSTKVNARLLKALLATPGLTMRDLEGPGLAPLRSLVKGELPRGERLYRTKVVPAVDPPAAAEVLARLIAFSKAHHYVPAASAVADEIGFDKNQIEAALDGVTYSTYIERLMDSGYLVDRWGKGGPTVTAAGGMKTMRAAFGGSYEPEVPLRELLPERVLKANPRWGRCRVDYVVTDVAGHDGITILGEFDGEHHFVHVVGQGNLHEHRERDRTRHRQLRWARKAGVDAYLLSVHWKLLRNPVEKGGATPEQLRAAFDAARAAGYTWIFVRPRGCEDLRAHLGKARRLDVDIDGIEVFVTN